MCAHTFLLIKRVYFWHIVTIKDIAEYANVSTGTVDRVIHERGKVSDIAREKVMQAIDELGYRKNIAASALAYKKPRRVVVVMPNPKEDLYWSEVERGITKAQEDTHHYRIEVEIAPFDLLKPTSLVKMGKKVLQDPPDAILFAPVFYRESVDFLDYAVEAQIPVAILNTYIDHEAVVCYTGQNSYQSGVLAARLLNFSLQINDHVVILQLAKSSIKGKHYIDKSEGFIDYFSQISEKNIKILIEETIDYNNRKKFKTFLKTLFIHYPAIKGIFVPNSRAHLLVDALPSKLSDSVSIVGFDLIEPNIKLLRQNKINFLINQNAVQQGYMGVMNLVNKLLLKTSIDKIQYLPLDTVVKENVEYYLNKPNQIQFVV